MDVPDEPLDNEPGPPEAAGAEPIPTGTEFEVSEDPAVDSGIGSNPDVDPIAAEIALDARGFDGAPPPPNGERSERPYGQRQRGGRGRRGGGDRVRNLDPALEQRPRRPNLDDLRPRRPDIEEPSQQRPRRPEDRQRRPESDGQRTPQPSQQSGRRPEGLEALVARQNVLFEEFAQQQGQALREVQRTVGNLSRGGVPTSAGGHTLALPKVAIFLDVPNLIYTSEQMGVRVHFGRLLDYLTEGRQLVRATAYAPITDDPTTRFETQRFVAPVIGHGYKIVSKPWKRFADGSMKANFDIELAVDILTMSDRLDIVVLLSGDGDFRRVCELVESKGVRVEVVAFAASTAMELRSVADQYTDLGQIMNIVGV